MKRELKFRLLADTGDTGAGLLWLHYEVNSRPTLLGWTCVVADLQFTGLKDRNGKEIYEGDILGGYPHGEAWVEYDSKFACWACKWYTENPDWDGEDALTEHVTVSDLLCNQLEDCGDTWEVIGNIHEHPDLVTK